MDPPTTITLAQPNMNDQKNTQLTKHRSEHVAYWKAHNKPTDEKSFTDGFNVGWSDAENASVANRDAMINQRKNEHAAQCGNTSFQWVFETGYREGFDAQRRCNSGQADTHDQKMAEMAKHKDAHIAYWKAHGNKQTDPRIFEDGFINGWCDCEQHLGDRNITANSMMGQRHQEHVRTFGNSPCEWAFDDGYREGFEGRRCMKPPATNPAPTGTTSTNPAPAAPQQSSATNPAPANPAKPALDADTIRRNMEAGMQAARDRAAANNHCHTPAAELPADHQCTSECDHRTKA